MTPAGPAAAGSCAVSATAPTITAAKAENALFIFELQPSGAHCVTMPRPAGSAFVAATAAQMRSFFYSLLGYFLTPAGCS